MKTGRTDVTAVLRDQHRQIRRALVRAAWPGRNRSRAFRQLVQLLSTHEAAEQAHIHPTVRRAGRQTTAAARVVEEKQATELLARLWKIGPEGNGYLRSLRSLRRAVLTHSAREEREEFPELDRLARWRRRMLGLEVRLARELAPTRPHPKVNGELANRLAVPVLGPADRCRDLVRRWRVYMS